MGDSVENQVKENNYQASLNLKEEIKRIIKEAPFFLQDKWAGIFIGFLVKKANRNRYLFDGFDDALMCFKIKIWEIGQKIKSGEIKINGGAWKTRSDSEQVIKQASQKIAYAYLKISINRYIEKVEDELDTQKRKDPNGQPLSLDEKVGDENGNKNKGLERNEIIPDKKILRPDQIAETRENEREILKMIKKLKETIGTKPEWEVIKSIVDKKNVKPEDIMTDTKQPANGYSYSIEKLKKQQILKKIMFNLQSRGTKGNRYLDGVIREIKRLSEGETDLEKLAYIRKFTLSKPDSFKLPQKEALTILSRLRKYREGKFNKNL